MKPTQVETCRKVESGVKNILSDTSHIYAYVYVSHIYICICNTYMYVHVSKMYPHV